jgi:branched-chain amino acid transport system ATP-binding protein
MIDRILNVAKKLADTGTSVLLVEQLVDKALATSKRVYALVQGRVVLDEPAGEPDLRGKLERVYLGSRQPAQRLA